MLTAQNQILLAIVFKPSLSTETLFLPRTTSHSFDPTLAYRMFSNLLTLVIAAAAVTAASIPVSVPVVRSAIG